MYLFSRRGRLAGGNGTAGVEWATEICERARSVSGLDIGLWATVYSEGWGTMSWTAFVPDLATLEAGGDKLLADSGYQALADKGASLTEGGLDDALFELVAGAPDPDADAEYVGATQAICASGSIAKGMMAAVGIAEKASSITGLQTMVVRSVTGPYAGVGWLTGYADIAAVDAASQALGADPSWVTYIDEQAGGAYAEVPDLTRTTMYRKLG